jgi:dTDP-4-dehydrorhamnose 3,5-epimerase
VNVANTDLPGVLVYKPDTHPDDRGSFTVVSSEDAYVHRFVQLNMLRSRFGVLRGLHCNVAGKQGKLVYAINGLHYSVAMDVRKGSPTAGRWHAQYLSPESGEQLWVPPGFAHGLLCLSDYGIAQYQSTQGYDPTNERALAWDCDADIVWPLPREKIVVTARDRQTRTLAEFWSSYE